MGEVFSLGHETVEKLSRLPTGLIEWMGSHLQDAFIIWNEQDRICFATESTTRLLGYQLDELIGEPWYEFIKPLKAEKVEQYLNNNHQDGLRMELLDKNNQSVYVEVHLTRMKDQYTEEIYFVSSLWNLSSVKEVKEMAIEADKISTVGQIAASIAHEIRNPLTAIKGFLQLLQAGIKHKDEYYRIMHDEVEKIESITSELLSLAKPSTLIKQNENIGSLIHDVVMLLQYQAKLKNITITVEEPISEIIYCDRSQIKQVLINLIKNGIEAMDEPGEITISTHSNEEYIILHVMDEGVGIPDDLIEKLDVAFFTTKEKGTGLGLNITKEILRDHGGFLKFMRNKSKGSTFQLFFPKIKDQK